MDRIKNKKSQIFLILPFLLPQQPQYFSHPVHPNILLFFLKFEGDLEALDGLNPKF